MEVLEDDKITIKKPVVSHEISEYIESTKGQELLDIMIDVEMRTTDLGAVGMSHEVAAFVENCLEDLVIARRYGYRIK